MLRGGLRRSIIAWIFVWLLLLTCTLHFRLEWLRTFLRSGMTQLARNISDLLANISKKNKKQNIFNPK